MARSPKPYRRLGRPKRALGLVHSLWLGSDHLLLVEHATVTERYRRLFFRDLRGLYLFPSRRRLWNTIVCLIPSAFGILLQFLDAPWEGYVPFHVVSALLLAVNFALGPTVTVSAFTGAHYLPLPSITRRRTARRLEQDLASPVQAAQADLRPDEVAPT